MGTGLGTAVSVRRPLCDDTHVPARAIFGVSVAVSVALFSTFYFTRFVHLNSNAWDSGTAEMFAVLRSQQGKYDRVCFAVLPAWYNVDTYMRYYLGDTTLVEIEDVRMPLCRLPGTIFATDVHHLPSDPNLTRIATAPDVDGRTFAVIAGRPS